MHIFVQKFISISLGLSQKKNLKSGYLELWFSVYMEFMNVHLMIKVIYKLLRFKIKLKSLMVIHVFV